MRRIRALIGKELVDQLRNRAALVPVVVVTLVSLIMPFMIIFVIPRLSGQTLARDPDLARVSRVVGAHGSLAADGQIQYFLFQQFLTLFLMTPITGAMALASHSIVGEKQARTLEPLLATPITTVELLIAKVLGAVLPTLGISLVGLAVYFGGIAAFAAPGVSLAMVSARTLLLITVVGPGAALVALQAAIVISSRVNDARTAQQFGVLLIIPLIGLLVAQFSGSLWLSATALGFIGLGLFGVWILLTLVSAALFQRESILTKWK